MSLQLESMAYFSTFVFGYRSRKRYFNYSVFFSLVGEACRNRKTEQSGLGPSGWQSRRYAAAGSADRERDRQLRLNIQHSFQGRWNIQRGSVSLCAIIF
jgi:hypothetical protein